MGVLAVDCPHCGMEKVAAECVGEWQLDRTGPEIFLSVVCRCNACRKVIGATVHLLNRTASPIKYQGALNFAPWVFDIVEIYPRWEPPKIPDYLPEQVERCLRQAAGTLHLMAADRSKVVSTTFRFLDASAMMYRKTLEVALKLIDPDIGEGVPLRKRIDKLGENGRLTKDMVEWAHQVRIDGNEAAHDIETIEEDAVEDLAAFTDLFLQYVFTLPEKLRLAKSRQTAAKAT